MIEIPLTQRKIAQVDDEFEFLNQHQWHALRGGSKPNSQYYAVYNIGRKTLTSTVYMHRVIMETKLGRPLLRTEEIDHIDHNGLKNTLDNLRITTHQQNMFNQRTQKIVKSSTYRGIYWDKSRSKWRARIKKNGVYIYLGQFESEHDAASAYNTAAKLYLGEYAQLNFSEDYDKTQ